MGFGWPRELAIAEHAAAARAALAAAKTESTSGAPRCCEASAVCSGHAHARTLAWGAIMRFFALKTKVRAAHKYGSR